MKIRTNQLFRIATIGLAAVAGVVVTGCGFINRNTNAGLPESEMSTTAVGAASGAVIGGGLGAIVGSTSGSAGEGVAIGAVAGAATGAGIGYQLERDQRALSDHRKSLAAQQELIARQGEEINEMKQAASDTRGSSGMRGGHRGGDSITTPELGVDITPGRSSAVGGRTKAKSSTNGIRDGYRGNPRAKPFVGGGELSSRSSASTARGRLKDRDLQGADLQVRATQGRPLQSGAAAAGVGSAAKRSAKPQEPEIEPLKVASVRTTPKVEHSLVDTAPSTSGLPPARLEVPKTAADDLTAATGAATTGPNLGAKETSKTARSAKAPKDQGDCLQATKEAERGLNASSDADRIFYLRRAARLCADEPAYHVELGKLYSEIGKHNDAKFEFRQAIDLDPDNQIARDELSILENSGGQ